MAKAFAFFIAVNTLYFHRIRVSNISVTMTLLKILIFISSLSFLGYGIAYFKSTKMKNEFKRFGLEKAGNLTAILELMGAAGLMVGLISHNILLVSSLGLAILMLLGVGLRIRAKDSFEAILPALFFLLLNSFIFFMSLPK